MPITVSMKAAIDLLHMTDISDVADKSGFRKNARKVAILGDMFELGADEAALHREVGVYAAEKNIDVVICVGQLCRDMYEGARSVESADTGIYYYADKAALFADIGDIIRDGDIVLVKASHGMHFEEVITRLS